MTDEINQNNQIPNKTTDIDLDIVSPQNIPVSVQQVTQSTKPNLNIELEQLEKTYKNEVSVEENLLTQADKLKKIKSEIEINITNRESTIKNELTELHNLKTKIEEEIKKVNDLKKADQEIDQDIEEINTLENNKQAIEEKIKNLEERLAGLK